MMMISHSIDSLASSVMVRPAFTARLNCTCQVSCCRCSSSFENLHFQSFKLRVCRLQQSICRIARSPRAMCIYLFIFSLLWKWQARYFKTIKIGSAGCGTFPCQALLCEIISGKGLSSMRACVRGYVYTRSLKLSIDLFVRTWPALQRAGRWSCWILHDMKVSHFKA